ncbi:cysteine--tRNA ligase [Candidatus Woesearchaeota archaeon CG10_big_fil_rev_8_21_14_0_10_44_13]|nr:MAG: cysteine--tRNA ligase [Candidatus Woesearchaeota archaeon CG10_big_fil_rev_8_21_14_0_10_44_13]
MPLKLFNTLTRKTELFKPIKAGEVKIYSCGPTVYDFAHIGNFRAYVCSDILVRYLEYKGFKVTQVMNLTDVDDKTIKGSMKEKISLDEYTKRYKKAFFDDIGSLNIRKADFYPEATKTIKEMVELVKTLMDKGFAYKGDDGSIYFSVKKFKDYGRLAHIDTKGLKSGARVKQDEYDKEQVNDFALWKAWDKNDGDVFWETELGKGRPGWHIECSAMSMKYLGKSFDIHTGGIDLIFPHHQNEIAQSEAATGKRFVNYWVHNEYLMVDGKKMSKSLGNFYTLKDLLDKGYKPKAIRYLLLSAHYRTHLNFTEESVSAAEHSVQRLLDFMEKLGTLKGDKENKEIKTLLGDIKKKFEEAMDNDLNVSSALASVFELVNKVNKLIAEDRIGRKDAQTIMGQMDDFDKVLGILEIEKEDVPKDIIQLAKDREEARKNKDFKKADRLRDRIKEKGYVLEDTPQGTKVKKV